ncbi:HAD-IA family hydrolase [Thermodesulfovibrionales bacterium]|nr:HAD-IA family hydrolase [Thermodesulfovibrionales bacterium]
MPIELLIFDLDGTLIDSSVDIANAINYAIEPHGIQPVTVEETINFVGEGITRLIEKIVEREGVNVNINRDALINRFIEHYSAHLIDNTTVYPYVRETLEELKGHKKAVLSNKREALARKTLDGLGLLKYFDLVVGSDTTKERKPSPVPIFYALSRMNASPDKTVIIGDSSFDIEAGKAADIKTIAVTYGYRSLNSLKGADFTINKMSELAGILRPK